MEFLIFSLIIMAGRPRFGTCFPEMKNPGLIKQLATSQNNFSRDLYIALSEESSGNLLFSPWSIMAALAMTHMGTSGDTEAQVQKVMHFNQDKQQIKTAFQEIIQDYKKEVKEYKLRTSNMVYFSHQLKVLDDFSNSLKKYFLSSPKLVDFGQSEIVRQEINGIVKKETKDKIKDLIPPGVLNYDTRMVLVNAVYFKGLWEHQFKDHLTKPQKFFITPEQSVEIPMMNIKHNFGWSPLPHLNANLLSMNYKGNRLSMVILLPEAIDGLATMEAKLANTNLQELGQRTASVKVRVTLPRFKLTQTFSLPKILSKMGMPDLFDDLKCDLSNINGGRDLFVSEVIHKSFIEVNEEGSEAAAATGIVVTWLSARFEPKPIHFVADHPFIFYIQDKLTDLILFIGRYNHI